MRFSLSFLLCLTGIMLFGQGYQPAHWMTTDGIVDSGLVKIPRRTLHSTNDIVYKTDRKAKAENPDDLRWLVCRGDTLFLEKKIDGYYRMLQLLMSGEVSLYRTIQHPLFADFFLHSNRFFEEVVPADGTDNFVVFADDDCKVFQWQKVKARERGLMRKVGQINKCRHVEARPQQSWQRNQWHLILGVKLDQRLWGDGRRYLTARFRLSESQWFVGVERYWSAIPGLSAQLGLRLLHDRFTSDYARRIFPGSDESSEFTIKEVYLGIPLSLGICYQLLPRYSVSPYLAGGGIAILPLQYMRTMKRISELSLPGFPDEQVVRGGTSADLGFYFQIGVRIALNHRIGLDLACRFQEYVQELDAIDFPRTYPPNYFHHYRYESLLEHREWQWSLGVTYRLSP